MKLPEPKPAPIDRTALCQRVDLLALLAGDGVSARKSGSTYLCAIRNERTPSCHLYPPGVGRRAAAMKWTWHDYGTGQGGDALDYLVKIRGMSEPDAVAELCRVNGEPAPAWQGTRPGGPVRRPDPTPATKTPPRLRAGYRMALDAQTGAAVHFLDTLLELDPTAPDQGAAYIRGRGVLPDGWPAIAYRVNVGTMPALLGRLAHSPHKDAMLEAGLLKPPEAGKPLRLQWGAWAGDVVLLVHHTPAGVPVAFIARRVDVKPGDAVGKYLQQTYARGAVRHAFGLPSLYASAGDKDMADVWPLGRGPGRRDELLVLEGTLDALGAVRLGWPALGLSMRPQATRHDDRDGAAARMLEAHLGTMRDMRRVRVVPDNDPGEKGAEGEALAARLVAWLRYAGVRADVATMRELCPDMPADCKDMADVAAMMCKEKPLAEKSPATHAPGGGPTRERVATRRGGRNTTP